MDQIRLAGRHLIEAAVRPTNAEVRFYSDLLCPASNNTRVPASKTPRAVVLNPKRPSHPMEASAAHPGVPKIPLASITTHAPTDNAAPPGAAPVWQHDMASMGGPGPLGSSMEDRVKGGSSISARTITPRGGEEVVEDAPRWEGRAVDSLAELERRMSALSGALESESHKRFQGYKRGQQAVEMAVACRWAEACTLDPKPE